MDVQLYKASRIDADERDPAMEPYANELT